MLVVALSAQGSGESWTLSRVHIVIMADGGILLEDKFDRLAADPCLDAVDVMEIIAIALMIGFALGYMCATKCGGHRTKVETMIIMKSTSTKASQAEPSCRTVGAQSQCTYKRKVVTPRFAVLPDSADGVFDVSFSA